MGTEQVSSLEMEPVLGKEDRYQELFLIILPVGEQNTSGLLSPVIWLWTQEGKTILVTLQFSHSGREI